MTARRRLAALATAIVVGAACAVTSPAEASWKPTVAAQPTLSAAVPPPTTSCANTGVLDITLSGTLGAVSTATASVDRVLFVLYLGETPLATIVPTGVSVPAPPAVVTGSMATSWGVSQAGSTLSYSATFPLAALTGALTSVLAGLLTGDTVQLAAETMIPVGAGYWLSPPTPLAGAPELDLLTGC